MKVCVIIANYNHSQFLETSVRSAMNQTHHDLEILVIDDGSSDQDQVRALVENLRLEDDRVTLLTLSSNFGKWHALNVAIAATECALITTQDADDTSLPDRISRQVAVFEALPGTLHVMTGFHHCWSQDEVIEKTQLRLGSNVPLRLVKKEDVSRMVRFGKNTPGINHYFTGQIETAGASAMFVRSAWELGIRFNPPGAGTRVLLSEDSDFNFRMTVLLNSTVILDEKLYCYRRNTSTNREEM